MLTSGCRVTVTPLPLEEDKKLNETSPSFFNFPYLHIQYLLTDVFMILPDNFLGQLKYTQWDDIPMRWYTHFCVYHLPIKKSENHRIIDCHLSADIVMYLDDPMVKNTKWYFQVAIYTLWYHWWRGIILTFRDVSLPSHHCTIKVSDTDGHATCWDKVRIYKIHNLKDDQHFCKDQQIPSTHVSRRWLYRPKSLLQL